jgi:hypothetical protein
VGVRGALEGGLCVAPRSEGGQETEANAKPKKENATAPAPDLPPLPPSPSPRAPLGPPNSTPFDLPKVITEEKSLRIAEYAFEFAYLNHRRVDPGGSGGVGGFVCGAGGGLCVDGGEGRVCGRGGRRPSHERTRAHRETCCTALHREV